MASPSGGTNLVLLRDGRSHAKGWEDGPQKDAGPVVASPAQVFRLD